MDSKLFIDFIRSQFCSSKRTSLLEPTVKQNSDQRQHINNNVHMFGEENQYTSSDWVPSLGQCEEVISKAYEDTMRKAIFDFSATVSGNMKEVGSENIIDEIYKAKDKCTTLIVCHPDTKDSIKNILEKENIYSYEIMTDPYLEEYKAYIVKDENLKHNMLNSKRRKEKEMKVNNENGEVLVLKVKYFTDKIDEIVCDEEKSDWIDLRAAEDVVLKAGESAIIKLGIGMILPDGYEAHIAPRSSTFKNYGIIQTNSVGVIDNKYSGDNDEWKMPVYATRDTEIHTNERICQFRIMKKQPKLGVEKVFHLNDEDRGGFGSTGKV